MKLTAAMVRAMTRLQRLDCAGLPGRLGQALVNRGLAVAEVSQCSVYPVRHFGEGRWGRVRKDYVSVAYRLTEAGKAQLA